MTDIVHRITLNVYIIYSIKVAKLPEGELIHQFPAGYSNSLTFSPKNTFLAAWGPYRSKYFASLIISI